MRGQVIVSFICGLCFALGLCLSGMTLPQNIIGFLDVLHWRPQLMLVMVGAIAVYAIAWRLIMRRERPILAAKFEKPSRRDIDKDLVLGAGLFGIGWGLGGFCGGPAIVSLVSGRWEAFVFVGGLIAGMVLAGQLVRHRAQRARAASSIDPMSTQT
jgi:uncharacterized membrane protein YedE/YeeE